ncbi:hypothetical protein LIA77_00405 [Sarocladium implicatum]|nr:hypothetical protein LIA77_00405 [Sarocladium implicatum]
MPCFHPPEYCRSIYFRIIPLQSRGSPCPVSLPTIKSVKVPASCSDPQANRVASPTSSVPLLYSVTTNTLPSRQPLQMEAGRPKFTKQPSNPSQIGRGPVMHQWTTSVMRARAQVYQRGAACSTCFLM